mgnify:CR=1 FL=1
MSGTPRQSATARMPLTQNHQNCNPMSLRPFGLSTSMNAGGRGREGKRVNILPMEDSNLLQQELQYLEISLWEKRVDEQYAVTIVWQRAMWNFQAFILIKMWSLQTVRLHQRLLPTTKAIVVRWWWEMLWWNFHYSSKISELPKH